MSLASTEWPPFYGADLEGNGFVTEIVREAFDRGGYGTDVSFLPWKRAMSGSETGRFDGLYTMWHREEREEVFVFSDPLPANEYVFFKRADVDITFESLEDLTEYKIGIVRGYAPPPNFDPEDYSTFPANDDEENLRKLLRGRVDLILTDRIVATHILNSVMPESAAEVEAMSPPLNVEPQYFVIAKAVENHAELMEAFNTGLSAMTTDGTLQEILDRYGF